MVIWSHTDAGYGYLALLFALFFLVPLVMLIQYLRQIFVPAMHNTENKHWLARLFFTIPIIILLILQGFALRIPLSLVDFYRSERLVLQGQVELISYEEDWGRHFNGYNVVLTVDGETFIPSDAFPWETVEQLDQGGVFKITYVRPKGGGTHVWEIESIS